MIVNCRKCGRRFDWDAGEGYAREPSGFLCSMSCELKEIYSQLAAVKAERDRMASAVVTLAEFAQSKGVFIIDESKELVREARRLAAQEKRDG